MSQVGIVGAYNSKFGALVQKNRETGEVTDVRSLHDLVVEAGRGALADAGIAGKDVDGVWVGSARRASSRTRSTWPRWRRRSIRRGSGSSR